MTNSEYGTKPTKQPGQNIQRIQKNIQVPSFFLILLRPKKNFFSLFSEKYSLKKNQWMFRYAYFSGCFFNLNQQQKLSHEVNRIVCRAPKYDCIKHFCSFEVVVAAGARTWTWLNLWGELKIAVQWCSPSKRTEQERVYSRELENIHMSKSRCAKLVASYSRRTVITAKSASTEFRVLIFVQKWYFFSFFN